MKFREYIKEFNDNDNEYIKPDIVNDECADWLEEEIPMFECSDKSIEKTYYFRWWTYRKHIKQTPEGYIITEFMPKVNWSGIYNVINAPVGHHLMEGRWLKNADKYLLDYINIFFNHPEEGMRYSNWMLWGIMQLDKIKDCIDPKSFTDNAVLYYKRWEESHKTDTDLFWSMDNYDAMEFSISGSPDKKPIPGLRPTLNSYMYADAMSIYNFSKKMSAPLEQYRDKAEKIRIAMNKILWRENFYKAVHPEDGDFSKSDKFDTTNVPRELIGYIPWYFSIPEDGDEVFELLKDKNVFLAKQGITTAEQTADRYLYEYNHECLWNGYVWPFATSQVLTALVNVIMKSDENRKKYSEMLFMLLHQYAEQHTRLTEDGKTVMWIDEVMSPDKHIWTSREILKNLGWRADKGGFERGKDYNHSTFCDIVISVLTGYTADGNNVEFNPIVPCGWEYFMIDNLYIKGKRYRIEYDKSGNKYGNAGVTVYENGIKINKEIK